MNRGRRQGRNLSHKHSFVRIFSWSRQCKLRWTVYRRCRSSTIKAPIAYSDRTRKTLPSGQWRYSLIRLDGTTCSKSAEYARRTSTRISFGTLGAVMCIVYNVWRITWQNDWKTVRGIFASSSAACVRFHSSRRSCMICSCLNKRRKLMSIMWIRCLTLYVRTSHVVCSRI